MNRIVLDCAVPASFSNQDQFYMKVAPDDLEKAKAFLKNIDANFRSGSILVANQTIVGQCKSEDHIQLTVETVKRKRGAGIKAVDVKVISK